METLRVISLQRATIDDLDAFVELEKRVCGTRTYGAASETREVVDALTNKIAYIIREGDTAVGTIVVTMKAPDHAYLGNLVVDPRCQGRGIAREAMLRVLDGLKGVKRIDLVTHPQNTKALILYLSLGFIVDSWKEDHFGDGEPRLALSLTRGES